MPRSVSILEVADETVWAELAARADLVPHLGEWLSPTRRVALPSFERELLPTLQVLVRYARHAPIPAEVSALAEAVASLPSDARRVLAAAQHHAVDGVVAGWHAWDPERDADAVRTLHGSGLLEALPEEPSLTGRYRLHPDLPPPAPRAYDLADAVMAAPDDLPPDGPGPLALLHDVASLAAAIELVRPKRTVAGSIAKADAKRLSDRIGGDLAAPRWAKAFRALEALGAAATDPLTREVHLDLGLDHTIAGEGAEAVDPLIRRLCEPDLHGVLPAVRAALHHAGEGAVDEVVFLDLLREQHRDVIFPAWVRGAATSYPVFGDEPPRSYDDVAWDAIEAPIVDRLLARLERLGVLRRAPGVFAATTDGRAWAQALAWAPPPVWVSSDLEVVVPPGAVTPWERFQLERLGRAVQRDVVDRYRLDRRSLERWLSTHDLDEALALLRRRSPAVPAVVEDTLRAWAAGAQRIVLVRGVRLP